MRQDHVLQELRFQGERQKPKQGIQSTEYQITGMYKGVVADVYRETRKGQKKLQRAADTRTEFSRMSWPPPGYKERSFQLATSMNKGKELRNHGYSGDCHQLQMKHEVLSTRKGAINKPKRKRANQEGDCVLGIVFKF